MICEKEIEFIIKFQSNNSSYGYNLTDGGDGIVGFKHTEETKKQMSESRKGSGNPMHGKTLEKNPRSIPVVQLTTCFEFVREWSCVVEITQTLGYNAGSLRKAYNDRNRIYKNFR